MAGIASRRQVDDVSESGHSIYMRTCGADVVHPVQCAQLRASIYRERLCAPLRKLTKNIT
jgi:hypothetical protein